MPAQGSPVLTALGVQYALSQSFWQRHDGHGDTEILKCPGRPRPAAGPKRSSSKRVAQVQEQVQARISG